MQSSCNCAVLTSILKKDVLYWMHSELRKKDGL